MRLRMFPEQVDKLSDHPVQRLRPCPRTLFTAFEPRLPLIDNASELDERLPVIARPQVQDLGCQLLAQLFAVGLAVLVSAKGPGSRRHARVREGRLLQQRLALIRQFEDGSICHAVLPQRRRHYRPTASSLHQIRRSNSATASVGSSSIADSHVFLPDRAVPATY